MLLEVKKIQIYDILKNQMKIRDEWFSSGEHKECEMLHQIFRQCQNKSSCLSVFLVTNTEECLLRVIDQG